jgi:hypothetical protein
MVGERVGGKKRGRKRLQGIGEERGRQHIYKSKQIMVLDKEEGGLGKTKGRGRGGGGGGGDGFPWQRSWRKRLILSVRKTLLN